MENELDRILNTNSVEQNPTLREQEKILKKVLRRRAKDGISIEELRKYLPIQIIDNSQLENYLKNLEANKDIMRKSEMVTDLRNTANIKEQHSNYLHGLGIDMNIKSVYRIDDLFPAGVD